MQRQMKIRYSNPLERFTVAVSVLLTAMGVMSVQAAVNSPARLKALAKMQDWSGQWELDGTPATFEPQAMPDPANASAPAMRDHPPYNAEWEARYVAFLNGDAELRAGRNTNRKYCAAGMPRILASPFMFEVTITPEKTWFYYTQREMRHIYTDGRKHPAEDDLWPTLWGDSIGHWDGDALLIETTSILAELYLDPSGATLSGEERVLERWTMTGKDSLQDEITIEDPVAFQPGKVWKFTRKFRRVKDYSRMIDDVCGENERHVLGDDGKLKTILN